MVSCLLSQEVIRMQVRISAWIICFIFVKKFSVRFYIFFPFLNQIFTLSLVSHYRLFLALLGFFFIINVGPVCPSEVVAWWAE